MLIRRFKVTRIEFPKALWLEFEMRSNMCLSNLRQTPKIDFTYRNLVTAV